MALATSCGSPDARSAETATSCEPTDGGVGVQGSIVISAEAGPCEVVLDSTTVTTLNIDHRESNDFRPPLRTLRNGNYIAPGSIPDHFTVWNTRGRPVASIGRKGEGPGEFLDIRALYVDKFDTVHVADAPGRWHVLDPQLTFVRSMSFPLHGWKSAVFLDDGRLLASDLPQGTHLFRLVDRNGKTAGNFGRMRTPSDMRLIAYAGGDEFWAVSQTEYRIERWDIDGQQLGEIIRSVAWFPASSAGSSWQMESRQPVIVMFELDPARRLWVTSAIPRTNGDGYRWQLEVFDTSRGTLITSRRYDSTRWLAAGLAGNRAYVAVEDSLGLTTAVLASYRFTQH